MYCVRNLLILAGASVACVVNSTPCYAQFNPVGNVNVAYSINSYLYNRPTVSPYLNLTRTDTGQIQPNYHALVRPQLEMRQQQAAQSAHIQKLNRGVEQIQSQQIRSEKERQLATGHPSRFFTYLHFYPEPSRPPQSPGR